MVAAMSLKHANRLAHLEATTYKLTTIYGLEFLRRNLHIQVLNHFHGTTWRETKERPGLTGKCSWPKYANGTYVWKRPGCLHFGSQRGMASSRSHSSSAWRTLKGPALCKGGIFLTRGDIPCSQHAALSSTQPPSNPRSQTAALPRNDAGSCPPHLLTGRVLHSALQRLVFMSPERNPCAFSPPTPSLGMSVSR